MKRYVGDKYYRFIGNDKTFEKKLQVIRLMNVKNEDSFVLQDEDTKGILRYNESQLDEYMRLRPDGLLFISIVSVADTDDVLVSLIRKKEMDMNISEPYLVCRQNIFDVFSQVLSNREDIKYVGLSLTRETTPIDMDFNAMLTCDKVKFSRCYSVYMDDSFDSIMRLIKTKKYDAVLTMLKAKMDKIASERHIQYFSYCNTLRTLLLYNGFMDDFYRAYGIIKIGVPLQLNEVNKTLVNWQKYLLEEHIKCTILDEIAVVFSKELEFNNIRRDYILVSDSEDILYVIVYTAGAYINRTYNGFTDKKEMDFFVNTKRKL